MHLTQRCCHCWKHFWHFCFGISFSGVVTFFRCLQYPENFVLLRHTLFLETATSHLESDKGNRMGVHFSNRFLGQKHLDKEYRMSWSIVMVENPIVGPNFRPLSMHSFRKLLQYFHMIILIYCLPLWEEFRVNSILDIKESDARFLRL
jgi:hypothetical protein